MEKCELFFHVQIGVYTIVSTKTRSYLVRDVKIPAEFCPNVYRLFECDNEDILNEYS